VAELGGQQGPCPPPPQAQKIFFKTYNYLNLKHKKINFHPFLLKIL